MFKNGDAALMDRGKKNETPIIIKKLSVDGLSANVETLEGDKFTIMTGRLSEVQVVEEEKEDGEV